MNEPETELTGDPNGCSHREIDPRTGQQKAYVVLSENERKKGFVEPVRLRYVHTTCAGVTQISLPIAETYARDPSFYNGTFCIHCGGHFPVGADGEFYWDGTNQKVGTLADADSTSMGRAGP